MLETVEALGRGIVYLALALFVLGIIVFSCVMIAVVIKGLRDEKEEARKHRK